MESFEYSFVHNTCFYQDKRLTAVRGKKYLQVAKNRYSGELGIVPLDFDKDALSYQAKKKTKKSQDEPEKLLNQCFQEYSIDEPTSMQDFDEKLNKHNFSGKYKNTCNTDRSSFLSDVLNSKT